MMASLLLSMRLTGLQLLKLLWEEETLVKISTVMWPELVVATTHKGFPWGKSS